MTSPPVYSSSDSYSPPYVANRPAFTCAPGPSDIVFLLDTSQSITEDDDSSSDGEVGRANWAEVRSFVADIVADLPVEEGQTRVGLARFSNSPETVFQLSARKSRFQGELSQYFPRLRGQTNLGKALKYLKRNFEWRSDVSNIIVVVTDGNADDDAAEQSTILRFEGFIIFAVGVGNVDRELLFGVSGSHERTFMVSGFRDLSSSLADIRQVVCTNYNTL